MRRLHDPVRVFTSNEEAESLKVKQLLSGHGVPFADLNITLQPDRRRELERLGHSRTPVTILGQEVVVGYQPEQILQALERLNS